MKYKNSKIKQLGATLCFVLLFLCVSPFVKGAAAETENNGASVQALQETDIVVNYSNETITVRANGNRELYYSFATVGKQPKEYRRIGSELIAGYQSGENQYAAFYIDLSSQTFKGETVFYAKYAEDDTAVMVTMPGREALKAVYQGIFTDDEVGQSYANAYALKINGEALYQNFTTDTGYFTFLCDGTDYTKLSNIEWRAGTAEVR